MSEEFQLELEEEEEEGEEEYEKIEEEEINSLVQIRSYMKNEEIVQVPLNAYIVPYHDEHMNEFLSESEKRLQFLTGFSGNGTGIITQTASKLWTDGRFFEKAEKETSWELMKSGLPGVLSETDWLKQNVPKNSNIGADPKLIAYPVWISMRDDLKKSNLTLNPISVNLVDLIWSQKPMKTINKLIVVPEEHSGMSISKKVALIQSKVKENADMLIITALDDIAWLLNLRGTDIPHNPLFLSFAVITAKNVHLFIDESQITNKIKNHFQREEFCLKLHPYDNFYQFVNEIVSSPKSKIGKVWIPSRTSFAVFEMIPEKKRYCECSPIQLLKSVKSDAEVLGMTNASIRDGVALCRFLFWLETNNVTEKEAENQLKSFLKNENLYFAPSMKMISSSGENSSIISYEGGETKIGNGFYLFESGSHYLDGTTDVARTFHFGEGSDFMKECYTRVLKGFIYLSGATFPPGIKGHVLDCLAKKHLWSVGLDYGHGSGHGVGCFLNVREGPIGISWRSYPDDPGLDADMFLTNETGYYHTEGEKFGIRIANVARVVKSQAPFRYQDKTFLKFEHITLCPIQTKMIIMSLLTKNEIDFINSYHSKILEILSPILKHRGYLQVNDWLVKATSPIGIPEEKEVKIIRRRRRKENQSTDNNKQETNKQDNNKQENNKQDNIKQENIQQPEKVI